MRLIALLVLLVSCCGSGPLRVRHQYLDPRQLPSSKVGSPDPDACCFYGQEIIINWHLSKEQFARPNLHLLLTVRLGSHEVEEIVVPIRRRYGKANYRVMADNYREKQGIVTYKIELIGGGCVLSTWRHQVWTRLIELPDEEA